MANELEIWALDGGGDVTPIAPAAHTESELELEDTLVKNPDLLMPGLTLIGRQTPTKGGPLDLLGYDENTGKLVVFELKRGPLTRDAVTQIIDYVSSLESMNEDELVEHIVERSKGKPGIEPFDYQSHKSNFPHVPLTPVQMTLVGLGADAGATRIVEFLAKRGMLMSMLTFHGYHYDGKVLLAKQVQTERDVAERVRAQASRNEREERTRLIENALDKRITESGIGEFWQDVLRAFRGRDNVRKDGFNFSHGHMKLPDHDKGFNIALSVRLAEEGRIRIVFSPASIHLCRREFQDSQIGFEEEQSDTPTTNEIQKQWFLDLGDAEWRKHKEELVRLANDVHKAWRQKVNEQRKSRG